MKRLRNLGLLVLLLTLVAATKSFAQAEVIFDNTFTFDDQKGGIFYSIESKSVLTPEGNILKTAVFKLPEDHFLVPETGVKSIGVGLTVVDIYGEEHYLVNYNIKIHKDGTFKIILHLNKSGEVFPRGW